VLFRRQTPDLSGAIARHNAGDGAEPPPPAAPTPAPSAPDFMDRVVPKSLALSNRAVTTRQVAELLEHQWLNYLTRDISIAFSCRERQPGCLESDYVAPNTT